MCTLLTRCSLIPLIFSIVPTTVTCTGDLHSLDIYVQQYENNAKWLPKTRHSHPYHLTSLVFVHTGPKPKIWIKYMKSYKQTVPEVTCQQNFAKTKHIVAGLLNCFKGCYRSKHMNIILGSGHVKRKTTVPLPRVVARLEKSSVS